MASRLLYLLGSKQSFRKGCHVSKVGKWEWAQWRADCGATSWWWGVVGEKQKRSEGQVCLRGADRQQRQFTVAHRNLQTDNASSCRGQTCPLTLDALPKAVGGTSQGCHKLRMCPPNVCVNFTWVLCHSWLWIWLSFFFSSLLKDPSFKMQNS